MVSLQVDVGLSITEITTSESAISRFAPVQRDCYTHDEVNLTALPLYKGYRMSMKNCLYDKALKDTLTECKCRPPFYVLGAVGKNMSTCQGTQLKCAYQKFDQVEDRRTPPAAVTSSGPLSSKATEARDSIQCMSPCNDMIYDSR